MELILQHMPGTVSTQVGVLLLTKRKAEQSQLVYLY